MEAIPPPDDCQSLAGQLGPAGIHVISAAVPKAVSRYGSTGTEVRTLLLGADGRRGDEIVGTTMDPPRLFSEEAKIPGDPAMAESAWFFQTIEDRAVRKDQEVRQEIRRTVVDEDRAPGALHSLAIDITISSARRRHSPKCPYGAFFTEPVTGVPSSRIA
jgi:hypothetical protein